MLESVVPEIKPLELIWPKSPGGTIGTTACTPGGAIFTLDVCVVATIWHSFGCLPFLIAVLKMSFCLFVWVSYSFSLALAFGENHNNSLASRPMNTNSRQCSSSARLVRLLYSLYTETDNRGLHISLASHVCWCACMYNSALPSVPLPSTWQ